MNWHEVFDYDPDTGKLFWKISPSDKVKVGQEAGSNDVHGYKQVQVLGKVYKVHRVIWELCNPNDVLSSGDQIDHIDHDRRNNRISNLRKVDSLGNRRNSGMSSLNTSGVTGVSWCRRRGRWRASIKINKVLKHLGYFDSFDDAVNVRKKAEEIYGFHKNHGVKR